jgi:hypothetical protein
VDRFLRRAQKDDGGGLGIGSYFFSWKIDISTRKQRKEPLVTLTEASDIRTEIHKALAYLHSDRDKQLKMPSSISFKI